MEIALLSDIINKEKEYKVEEVQNHRKQRHNIQFLVYWNCILYYSHIIVEASSCFPYFLFIVSSWSLDIYSSRYSFVFLHFTN